MAIRLQTGKNFYKTELKYSEVHSLPCHIHADVDAKVSEYFTKVIQKNSEDDTLTASFRGHALKGKCLEVPKGYTGLVLHESIRPVREKDDRNFYPINNFKEFTYWNWDRNPTKDDAFQQALDWIDIAEALHSPIEEDS